MATSDEIKQRASALAEKTDVNSITPKEVGGIMYDLASHGENVLRNGGTLGIRKVYASIAEMEADTNLKDFWGNPLKKGNLVVIYDGTTTGADNNKVYAYMNPGWQLATDLDAGYATRSEFSKLASEVENLKKNPNIDIVNNLTEGGTDKVLSAEMGKQLGEAIYGNGSGDLIETITQADFNSKEYISIHSTPRGAISFVVDDFDTFTASLEVISGSPIKVAMHRTKNTTSWSYTADTGWLTDGLSLTVDNSFGTGKYIRLVTTYNSGSGVPTFDELVSNIKFTLTKRTNAVDGLMKIGDDVKRLEQSVNNRIDSVESKLAKPVFFELKKIPDMTINTVDGAASNTDGEIIDYVNVLDYDKILVRGGFWNSTNSNFSSIIELYDTAKRVVQKIIPAQLIGLTNTAYAYVFEGEIDVSNAAYIRFANLIKIPTSNTNVNFEPIEASVSNEYLKIDAKQVIDTSNNKTQSEINTELNQTIFGNKGDIIEDVVTQNDLTEEDYLSTSIGGGRGFYNIPIGAYDNYLLSLSVASNSTVKSAITLLHVAYYADNSIYDSKWIVAGGASSVNKNTSTSTNIKYIQLRFTYISSGSGVPTIEEIKQYISIDFRGVKFADFGLVGKVSDLVKAVFPESTAGYEYQGEKVSFKDNTFTSEVIGNLSAGVSSRQGGAVYGDYLFQFHNTLATIVVYNLRTKKNVQTLSLTANSSNHAGSGGFGNEFYADGDAFPILYISSMNEKRVYGFRITGNEGSWNIELVQTITLEFDWYIPNVAIDRENNMIVVFAYTKNSWSDSSNNLSVITSCVLPSVKDGDVTISEFSDARKIPFIYAEQGAFARLGKLYLSYGNTESKCGMYVIDYVSGIAVSHASFEPLGTFEPEAFVLYEGNIIMTDQNGNVYKLMF